MNYSAEIVAAILDGGIHDVDALTDHVGLSGKAFDALTSKLCGEGVLHRDGHRLTIQNEGRASVLAEQARLQISRADRAEAPAPVRSERPIPPRPRQRAIELAPPPDLKIESNIPMPDRWRPARTIPWPFGNMSIGQSFAVPIGDRAMKQVEQALRRDADAFRQRINPNFHVMIRPEPSGDSIRLWRVTKFERKTRETKDEPAASLATVASLPAPAMRNGSGIRVTRKKKVAA